MRDESTDFLDKLTCGTNRSNWDLLLQYVMAVHECARVEGPFCW